MGFKLAPGDTPLAGFTIKRGLGLGGFGEVYFAVTDAGKEVALKRIHRNLSVEFRGAQHCLNLRHPNLVALYDIRPEDDEQGWIVMEYISGENLKDCLDRSPNGLPEIEAVQLFGQIGAAVSYLHDQGIVHRDLKPANVFLEHGLVKVGDYGLSKFISASKRAGQTESVGTFHYMAPEIGKGEYGKEIDVYALGIILYEMLTGRVPFDGESSQEIIMKHLTSDPDLSQLKPPYRNAIGKALMKDPSQRYSSVVEFLEAIGLTIDQTGMAKFLVDKRPEFIPQAVPTVAPANYQPERYYREPIANAVASALASMQRSIERVPHGSPKIILMILAFAFAVTFFGMLLLPHLMWLGLVYAVYYMFWYVLVGRSAAPIEHSVHARHLKSSGSQVPGDLRDGAAKQRLQPVALQRDQNRTDVKQVPSPRNFSEWQLVKRSELKKQAWATRWRQWTASSLKAAGCLSILAAIGGLAIVANDRSLSNSNDIIAISTWTALMTLLTSWTILFFAKYWESKPEDSLMNRFVMVACGFFLGGIGLVASEYLQVPWSQLLTGRSVPYVHWTFSTPEFSLGSTPAATKLIAFFASLMGIVRWWRQADVVRRSRFSLFGIAWAVIVAGMAAGMLGLPQSWCMILSGATSFLVQLSTHTIHTRVRHVNANHT